MYKTPAVRAVRTMVVAAKPVEDDRRAIGEVKARYESDLGFRVSGKIVARLVEVGAAVKKGCWHASIPRIIRANSSRRSPTLLLRTPPW